ncbi:hypothetical protein [Aquisalimonas sp.]|uniref:hypothetical protein n=1 Tax=Aquisalimonas sp. TaxID=1872621 RepID=UPI0025B8C683|nr:hypothetical protein [Aquisalimonas sp.]
MGYVSLHREIKTQRGLTLTRAVEVRRRLKRVHSRLQTPTVVLPAFVCGVIVGRLWPQLVPVREMVATLVGLSADVRQVNAALGHLMMLLRWLDNGRELDRRSGTVEVAQDRLA